MAHHVTETTRQKTAEDTDRHKRREFSDEEQNILRDAMCYCLHHFPMLWTTGGIREEQTTDSTRRWIIAVNLRYPTGHQGYLGDLLYDGKEFTELTQRDLMCERAKLIEADPALQREWNEHQAATLPPRNP